MTFNQTLFDAINGVAGRYIWLDHLGQLLAVFGLLGILLLVLAICWWPRWDIETRRHYLFAVLTSMAVCLILLAAEWVITSFILHRDLRARPANVNWATLLITERSHLSFPAWPVVFAFALGLPTYRLTRRLGMISLLLGGFIALSLVFVGVNYPNDVLTGILLGSAIGFPTSLFLQKRTSGTRDARWMITGAVWLGLMFWGGVLLVTTKPARGPEDATGTAETQTASQVTLTPPQDISQKLTVIAQPGTLDLQAATNGHLVVASAKIVLPDAQVDLPHVEDLARRMTNSLFSGWKPLDLLTVEISANFSKSTRAQVGTLYTATIARSQWPAAGFSLTEKLPGMKYYHTRFTRQQDHNTLHPPVSTKRL